MSTQDDIARIKANEDISQIQRLWQALEVVAAAVDRAPDDGAKKAVQDISRMMR